MDETDHGVREPDPGLQADHWAHKVLSLIQPEEKRINHALDLESRGEHLNILHAPGFINLDCGCGYDMPIKALACLRLEDFQEFYI